MNSPYKLLFLILILIIGCKNREIDDIKFTQSINSLNMNIFSYEGKKLLSIKSPYSNYNKQENTFNLKQTTINLFNNNELEYVINSDISKLSKNNKFLELNGNVLVKSFIQKDDKLYANKFTWNIEDSKYILVGDVKFKNNSVTLSSNKAILNKSNNVIEFFKPVKYKIDDINTESGYEINSNNAYYNIETKSVSFVSKDDRVRSKIYF